MDLAIKQIRGRAANLLSLTGYKEQTICSIPLKAGMSNIDHKDELK